MRILPTNSPHTPAKVLCEDDAAMLGMPLNLSIAMLVLMLVAPLAYSGLHSFGVNTTQGEVDTQVRLLFQIAEVVYLSEDGAPSSQMEFTLNLQDRATARLENVRLGGDVAGEDAAQAKYADFEIDGRRYFVVAEGFQVPLMADTESGELHPSMGRTLLSLTLVDPEMEDSTPPHACQAGKAAGVRFVCVQEAPE